MNKKLILTMLCSISLSANSLAMLGHARKYINQRFAPKTYSKPTATSTSTVVTAGGTSFLGSMASYLGSEQDLSSINPEERAAQQQLPKNLIVQEKSTGKKSLLGSLIATATDWLYPKYTHPVPDDIKQLLDDHIENLREFQSSYVSSAGGHFLGGFGGGGAISFPWLPGYVVSKHGKDRIKGAKLIKKIVDEHPNTMNLITVPTQYLYIDKNNPSSYGGDYLIAIKEEGAKSLAEIRDEYNPPTLHILIACNHGSDYQLNLCNLI